MNKFQMLSWDIPNSLKYILRNRTHEVQTSSITMMVKDVFLANKRPTTSAILKEEAQAEHTLKHNCANTSANTSISSNTCAMPQTQTYTQAQKQGQAQTEAQVQESTQTQAQTNTNKSTSGRKSAITQICLAEDIEREK